jgi:UDP-N-acetylglucosamine 2-epimerase (non-hydrolysing)
LLTDQIADFLFVTEKSGLENLKNEGIPDSKIFFVGNTMIDSLVYYLPKIEKSSILDDMNLSPKEYVVVTLHRPSNVDQPENLIKIFNQFKIIAEKYKIVFPIHPRTKKVLQSTNYDYNHPNFLLVDPIGYISFIKLVKKSIAVITDSGGIQEETTYLKIPCLTLRDNTERPITAEIGTNKLIGTRYEIISDEFFSFINNSFEKSQIPPLWDGKAAERITAKLVELIY